MAAEVLTLCASNRTDWLRVMASGERDGVEVYEVDGRPVTALARWPAHLRAGLRLLSPAYHAPGGPVPTLMARLLEKEVGRALQPPAIVHNVFIGREPFSLALMDAAHARGQPFVFTPLRHQRPFGWNSPAFRRIYRDADAVVGLTRTEADWLGRQGARRDRLHVAGLGPSNDAAAAPYLARAHLGWEGPYVLFLGQLHSYKGYQALLAAAGRMRDLRDLLFVFAGPDVRGNAAAFRGSEPNVRYIGTVDEELRDSLLAGCLALCSPSSRESFGATVVEAWNCGRPVLVGPAAASRELVSDGVDGYLVGQEPALIEARVRELHRDPALAGELGRRGREKMLRHYSWEAIGEAHRRIYAGVRS
jgi:glycosyltransferase involved in cell wall biosynthesis